MNCPNCDAALTPHRAWKEGVGHVDALRCGACALVYWPEAIAAGGDSGAPVREDITDVDLEVSKGVSSDEPMSGDADSDRHAARGRRRRGGD